MESFLILQADDKTHKRIRKRFDDTIPNGANKCDKDISCELFSRLTEKNPDSDKVIEDKILADVFSAVRISDSKPLLCKQLTLCKKIDVGTNGNESKSPPNVTRECLRPNVTAEFSMSVDDRALKGSGFDFSTQFFYDALDKTMACYRYCYIDQFDNDNVDSQSDFQPEHIFFLGGGCGFGSKTIAHSVYGDKESYLKKARDIMVKTTPSKHHHENDNPVSPRKRKLTKYNSELYDFGLCKLTIEEV